MYLENIKGPEDVKKLNITELKVLGEEIREALITKVSTKGGHFGPNLGVVELTIALHSVFNSPVDKFVFDVSHQTYPHKMLTGRSRAFLEPEHYNDYTGYSNQNESVHDHFILGHTSSSISLAAGLARARDAKKEKGNVIAIIGDGSLSGGQALEGLNIAGEMNSNFIIIVNDNDMSIAENHGGLYKGLKELRETNGLSPNNIFKSMGLEYHYVNDGNNLEDMIEALSKLKDIDHPVVLHIHTQKGKGYKIAEEMREPFHYSAPFDVETGKLKYISTDTTYASITRDYLVDKMSKDEKVLTITAGTPSVLGFTKDLRDRFSNQFIDTGIAEQVAVSLASGIAYNGAKPVFGVISSFIQRAYDQLSQDVAINNNAATFVIYYGTVLGMNDVTHLGWFDIPLVSNIPNMVFLAPATAEEHLAMLEWSIEQNEHPVSILLPGGSLVSTGKEYKKDFSILNKFDLVEKGSKVAIIAAGTFFSLGSEVAHEYFEKTQVKPTLINPQFLSGLDTDLLNNLKENHDLVITIEDGILDGGFGQKIASFYGDSDIKVLNYGIKKEFKDRYVHSELLKENRLTKEQILEDLLK